MAEIELKNVSKSYGAVDVIKGVDLKIEKGEFMVFVGPSGSGKSTLLRLISGLETITGGDMTFDGQLVNNVLPSKRGIAMVFQSYALYPHMTVRENMEFGMKLAKSDRASMDKRVGEAAKLLEIDHLLDRLPKQLSGGQRQRVAIGRAITRDPRVFLFDEPLSNLDAALRVQTRLEIAKLHHSMNDVTMIYVTHDQVEAMTLADRICVLRDGQVEQVGSPQELYDNPDSVFVAGFIGSPQMNFLRGDLAAKFDCHVLGVRSEHMDIVTKDEDWEGPVLHVEDLGSDSYAFIEIGSELPLIVRQSGHAKVEIGQTLKVKADPARLYKFDENEKPIR